MTNIIIPLNGGMPVAQALSAGVYKLSQPDSVRPADYVSAYAFLCIQYPQTGQAAIMLDDQQMVPCNVAADPSELLALIEPLTTQDERDQLAGYVKANAGQRVPLANLVPPEAMSHAMTREQAAAAGWFALQGNAEA